MSHDTGTAASPGANLNQRDLWPASQVFHWNLRMTNNIFQPKKNHTMSILITSFKKFICTCIVVAVKQGLLFSDTRHNLQPDNLMESYKHLLGVKKKSYVKQAP